MRHYIVILVVFILIGCEQHGGGTKGFISIGLSNARGPEGVDLSTMQGYASQTLSQSALQALDVNQFKVTISGEGIATPLTTTASATSKEIEVLDIPMGTNRSILIEATNSDGTVIRRRKLEGVQIIPNVITPIKTSLFTIPLILSPKDGGLVFSRNYKINGFGEPSAAIKVEATTSKSEAVDLSRSSGLSGGVISPAQSTGLFEFSPKGFSLGKQTIKITDEGTGESSTITVMVVKEGYPGRRLAPAGKIGPATTVGNEFGGGKESNFPKVLKKLSGKEG